MWARRARYVLGLLGLCAIATCPTAKRTCVAHRHAEEAREILGYLGDRVAQAVAATGKVPPAPAGPTPSPGCCDRGGTCSPDPSLWDAPGWRALQFTIDGDFRYSYEYIPDPSGDAATVRATGDLDCDGVSSRYELRLTVHGSTVDRTWSTKDPYE